MYFLIFIILRDVHTSLNLEEKILLDLEKKNIGLHLKTVYNR
jgi:hypothetical protein